MDIDILRCQGRGFSFRHTGIISADEPKQRNTDPKAYARERERKQPIGQKADQHKDARRNTAETAQTLFLLFCQTKLPSVTHSDSLLPFISMPRRNTP